MDPSDEPFAKWLMATAVSINGESPEVWNGTVASVRHLDLSNKHLRDLPPEFSRLTELQSLNLSRNEFGSVPPVVPRLTSLRSVNLSRCGMTTLPAVIGELGALEELVVARNRLTVVPEEIGRLSALRRLILRSNRLLRLPDEIGDLAQLIELDVSENDLAAIPLSIGSLERMESLFFAGNNVTVVPKALAGCRRLKNLSLSSNSIEVIPASVLRLPYLSRLVAYDNPFREPPVGIVGRGLAAMKQWAHDQSLHEPAAKTVRVQIVGASRVGKSSLVDRVVHKTHSRTRRKTASIEVTAWALDDDVVLDFWDFAGDEHLHQVHGMFIAEPAVTIVVVASDLTAEAEYWLRLTQGVARPRSVVLVVNKLDVDPDRDVDRSHLYAKWSCISHIVRCSFRTGDGADHLIAALTEAGRRAASQGPIATSTSSRLMARLRERAEPWITSEAFIAMCADLGIERAAGEEWLTAHVLAKAIATVHEGLLSAVVIDAAWLVRGVYALCSNAVVRNEGRFSIDQAKALLSDHGYGDDDVSVVVRAMVDSGVAVRPQHEVIVVVPQLLKDRRPDLEAAPETSIRLTTTLEVLPPTLFSKFLATIGGAAVELWRSGAHLRDGWFDSDARILLDSELRTVSFTAWGTGAHEFLTVLRHRLAHLAQESGIGIDERVPLGDRTFVPLRELMAYARRDWLQYREPHSGKIYDVYRLIYGRSSGDRGPDGTTRSQDMQGKSGRHLSIGTLQADNVSFGDDAVQVSVTGGLDDAISTLVTALRSAGFDSAAAIAAEAEMAQDVGDRGRLRAVALQALDSGAKVGSVTSAALAVLSHLS